ncbi:uncharacterized protein LOC130408860 [Triplophysa dalaica]|uniref:uncharacterized protein LOC130408860 n=1 Tax=Triplophysa dalaica TaxID=1582913 RepID=UPI0024DFBCF6|nr:uncharacterized protein LOC130408860 [Triplophysa dalaica]
MRRRQMLTSPETMTATPRMDAQHNTFGGHRQQHKTPESSQTRHHVLRQQTTKSPQDHQMRRRQRLTSPETMTATPRMDAQHNTFGGHRQQHKTPESSQTRHHVLRGTHNEHSSVRRRIKESFSRPSGRTERVLSSVPNSSQSHPRTPQSALGTEHRNECGTRPSRSAYPMSTARFQRKVFSMLLSLKEELQHIAGILDPASLHLPLRCWIQKVT